MTMQYDVKSASANASAQLVSSRTRLKSAIFVGNGSAGTVTFYDTAANSATGTVLWQTKTNTGVQPFQVLIPGEGILYRTNLYLTLSVGSVTGLTFFYG